MTQRKLYLEIQMHGLSSTTSQIYKVYPNPYIPWTPNPEI